MSVKICIVCMLYTQYFEKEKVKQLKYHKFVFYNFLTYKHSYEFVNATAQLKKIKKK